MKKRFLYILSAVSIAFSSCQMDIPSPDSLSYDKAFESLGNVEALEGGLYSRLRTAYSVFSMIAPDIQADYVNPVNGFSNTHGNIYNWTYTQDEGECASVWQDFYGVIGHANFIIDGIDSKISFTVLPGSSEQAVLNRVQGAAYLSRALAYSVLAERFCADYEASTASAQYSGLPLSVKYDPNIVPDRSTLQQVYDQIFKDLASARKLLKKTSGLPNSTKFNLDCVDFLEARILLQTDQHKAAYTKAMNFFKNHKQYSLVDCAEDLQEAWIYDESPETLFQFYASKTEFTYAFGSYFCSDNFAGMNPQLRLLVPDFIPTKATLDMYAPEDWRATAYFQTCSSDRPHTDGLMYVPYIKGYGTIADNVTLITKYPGNPEYRTSAAWNYVNTFKVFRLAELYLIAAEAGVKAGEDAAEPLNALREGRGLAELSKVSLQDVKDERFREMLLEGSRLTDLKRWGDGLSRGAVQTALVQTNPDRNEWEGLPIVTELYKDLKVSKDDYRFVWPVPSAEIFANPAYGAQQNPGWKR